MQKTLMTLGLVAILAGACFAQTQRLGIPVGDFAVDANGKLARRGYCMDAGVKAPAPGARLSHVLTDAANIEVRIGDGPPKSLQRALEANQVRLEAKAMFEGATLSDVMNDSKVDANMQLFLALKAIQHKELFHSLLDKPVGEASKGIAQYIKSKTLSKTEAAQLRDIADYLSGGDGEHVVFVNLTGKRLAISVKEVAVVGEQPGALKDVVLPNVVPSRGDADQKAIQTAVWFDNSAIHAAQSNKDANSYLQSVEARAPVKSFVRVGSETHVLVQRDKTIEVRIVEQDQIKDRLSGPEALARYSALLASVVASASGERTKFAMLTRHHDGKPAAVRFALGKDMVELSKDDFETLLKTGSVPASLDAQFRSLPEGSRIVLWRDPLMQSNSPERMGEFTALATALHAKYGKRINVFLDDDMTKSVERIDTIAPVAKPTDVALIADKLSFPVNDHGIVDDVEAKFKQAGLTVYASLPEQAVTEANLVVLTGHKDQAYRDYVDALIDKGVLQDRVVLMFSCYAKGDERFNSSSLSTDKAPKAIVFFPDELDATAVSDVLKNFADRLKKEPGEPASIRSLLDKSIDEVLADPDATNELKSEAEKMRRAVIQVSALVSGAEAIVG
jgi:hypothetical protein